jgi:hypothetical protein
MAELGLSRIGFEELGELRQSHDLLLLVARDKGQPLVLNPHSGVGGAPDGARPGNPTAYTTILVPVVVEGRAQHLIEVWVDPGFVPDQHYRMVQMLVVLAGAASTFVRMRKIRTLAGQQELWTQIESFSRQIHSSLDPIEVSYTVANEGRRLIGCDRLSVVQRGGRKARVEAISGAEVVERRSNLVRLLASLGDKVLDFNERLFFAGVPDDAMPPVLRDALDGYLEESGCKTLVVQPVRDPREKDEVKPCRSALVMECFETGPDPKLLTERLDILGKHAATALYNADEYRRIPLPWLWKPIAMVQKGLGGKARAITAGVIVGVVVLLAVLIFVPYPLKMDAKGQLLPEARSWIYAPMNGHVDDFLIDPNEDVADHEPLIRMYDQELASKLRNLSKEIEAADQEIQAYNARLDTAAKDERERAMINIEIKKQQSIRGIKLDELNHLRAITGSDEARPGWFFVKSPMNGTVLNADFKENLRGKFVRPSDPLLRVGNQQGPWEIELKVPQKHVGQILAAFSRPNAPKELDVDLLLLSDPTKIYRGKLAKHKIAGEAAVRREEGDETEPVVLALVRIEGDDIPADELLPRKQLLTGTEVHAKVRCGNRAMGYSLFYGAWEFFFEKVVFFF